MTLPLFSAFGPFLRYLRKRADLTQRDLANAIGYSEAHLSRLERGERLPDISMVAAQFVQALYLEHQPALATQLLELAAAAHGETLAETQITFNHTARAEAMLRMVMPPESTPSSKAEPLPALQASSPSPFVMLIDGLAGMPGSPRTGVEQFLREYLGITGAAALFGGRDEPLELLDRWLDDPGQPHALLVAPAGRGKSALLAQWVARVVEHGSILISPAPSSHCSVLALRRRPSRAGRP